MSYHRVGQPHYGDGSLIGTVQRPGPRIGPSNACAIPRLIVVGHGQFVPASAPGSFTGDRRAATVRVPGSGPHDGRVWPASSVATYLSRRTLLTGGRDTERGPKRKARRPKGLEVSLPWARTSYRSRQEEASWSVGSGYVSAGGPSRRGSRRSIAGRRRGACCRTEAERPPRHPGSTARAGAGTARWRPAGDVREESGVQAPGRPADRSGLPGRRVVEEPVVEVRQGAGGDEDQVVGSGPPY